MGNRHVLTARKAAIAALGVVTVSFGLSGVFHTPDTRPGIDVAAASAARAPGSGDAGVGTGRVTGVLSSDVTVEVTLLQSRADAWHMAYDNERDRNVQEAVALAQQVAADEERAVDEFLESIATTTSAAPEPEPAPAPAPDPAAAVPTDTAPASTEPPPPAAPPAPAEPDVWARLRQCESGGNYAAVSRSGRYRGAYQFSQTTWDWIAARRYAHLVGIDPAAAAPADQDAMALALFEIQGPGAWPVCRYVFG